MSIDLKYIKQLIDQSVELERERCIALCYGLATKAQNLSDIKAFRAAAEAIKERGTNESLHNL